MASIEDDALDYYRKKKAADLASYPAATPGNEWGSLRDNWGIARPTPGSLPTMGAPAPQQTPSAPAPPAIARQAIPIDSVEGMRSPGSLINPLVSVPGTLIDNGAGNQRWGGNIFSGDSRQIGATGSSSGPPSPLYQADYRDAKGNVIAGISGPDQRVGGGTVSQTDQGNGGTVEGNVAAINRQTEALRSLNQARMDEPYVGRFRFGADDIGKPGTSFGDEILARDRAMRNPKQFAMYMQDRTLQNQQDQSAADLASKERIAGGAQQAGILKGMLDAQSDASRQQFDRQKWAQQYGLDVAKLGLATAKPNLSPYDTELQKQQAKQEVERQKKQKEDVAKLGDVFGKADILSGLTGDTGYFAPIAGNVSRMIGGERGSRMEQFNAQSNDLVTAIIKQLGANPSDADREFLKKTVPQYGNTPSGNKAIIDTLKQFAIKKAIESGANASDLINRRGAELEARGLTKDQAIDQLRREFSGAY